MDEVVVQHELERGWNLAQLLHDRLGLGGCEVNGLQQEQRVDVQPGVRFGDGAGS